MFQKDLRLKCNENLHNRISSFLSCSIFYGIVFNKSLLTWASQVAIFTRYEKKGEITI